MGGVPRPVHHIVKEKKLGWVSVSTKLDVYNPKKLIFEKKFGKFVRFKYGCSVAVSTVFPWIWRSYFITY